MDLVVLETYILYLDIADEDINDRHQTFAGMVDLSPLPDWSQVDAQNNRIIFAPDEIGEFSFTVYIEDDDSVGQG